MNDRASASIATILFACAWAWACASTSCAPADSTPAAVGEAPEAGSPARPDAAAGPEAAPPDSATTPAPLRDVLLVGNSVSGSVTFLDAHSFDNLGSIDVIPDLTARL